VWTGPLPMLGWQQNTWRGSRNRVIVALVGIFAPRVVLEIIQGAQGPDLVLGMPSSAGKGSGRSYGD
jgi:hypothetical protein